MFSDLAHWATPKPSNQPPHLPANSCLNTKPLFKQYNLTYVYTECVTNIKCANFFAKTKVGEP